MLWGRGVDSPCPEQDECEFVPYPECIRTWRQDFSKQSSSTPPPHAHWDSTYPSGDLAGEIAMHSAFSFPPKVPEPVGLAEIHMYVDVAAVPV